MVVMMIMIVLMIASRLRQSGRSAMPVTQPVCGVMVKPVPVRRVPLRPIFPVSRFPHASRVSVGQPGSVLVETVLVRGLAGVMHPGYASRVGDAGLVPVDRIS